MKKNLRIVSAAAAALLAVAPVAATAVAQPATTVQAATPAPVDPAQLNSNWHITFKGTNQSLYTNSDLTEGRRSVSANGTKVTAQLVAQGQTGVVANDVAPVNSVWKITSGKYAGLYIGSKNVNVNAPAAAVVSAKETKETSYFATARHNALSNGRTVYATNGQSNYLFNMANSEGKLTINDLKDQIKYVLGNSEFDGVSVKQNPDAWDKYVFGKDNATSDSYIISQLEHAGIKVNGIDGTATFDANVKSLNIPVWSNGGMNVNVVFNNEDYAEKDTPVLRYRDEANQPFANLLESNGKVNALNIAQNDDASKWQPSELFTAWNNSNQHARINVSFSNDNVDITKPGIYSITVTAKNAAGKTSTAVVPVFVSDVNGKKMTVANDTNIYTEENGKMVQSNILNYSHLNNGQQVRVFDEVTVDGVQYYRLFSKNSNFFVKASDLKGYVAPSTTPAETTKNVTIMHIAAIYDKNGKQTSETKLGAYHEVSVVAEPVTLKDKDGKDVAGKFYKLAGKDQYIKVGNVEGTVRTLKHNSYKYKSNLKAYTHKVGKKTKKIVVKSGSQVKTYGSAFKMADGKMYYRIDKNTYIKKANF